MIPKSVQCIVFFLLINAVSAQTKFQKSFQDDARPLKTSMRIDFKDQSGNEGFLPISVIKGKFDGPVFTIIAGIHGFEYPPIVATQKLMKEIDIEQLKGTASFFSRTPFVNPQDTKNLNNAFPGKAEGSITARIADFITTNIIPATDVLLDIHGGDACEDLIPFVCYYNNTKKQEQTALARKLAESSGFEFVISYPYTLKDSDPAKYTFKQAVQDGKTALSIECGKLGNVQEENVSLIKKGVYNMLETLEMYTNGSGPHPNITYRNSQTYIKAKIQGIFYSKHKAGDMVKKEEIVGYTTDEFGTVLEEYKAPNNGIILYKLATPPVNNSDTIMCISSIAND